MKLHIPPACFIHKVINMHPTLRQEKYNHSICSTICAQECSECIHFGLARRSEGAATARHAVCCDNLLAAWTQAANEASPLFNPDVPFNHSAEGRDERIALHAAAAVGERCEASPGEPYRLQQLLAAHFHTAASNS